MYAGLDCIVGIFESQDEDTYIAHVMAHHKYREFIFVSWPLLYLVLNI